MTQWIVISFMLVCLCGCGGSGSSGSGDSNQTPQDEAAQRDLDFREEAVNRVLNQTEIDCRLAQCFFADREDDFDQATTGRLVHLCSYNCVPVEIDLSGEVRYYEVLPSWSRLPDGCYELDDRIIVAQHLQPCVPTF